jgi:hypothetical protein
VQKTPHCGDLLRLRLVLISCIPTSAQAANQLTRSRMQLQDQALSIGVAKLNRLKARAQCTSLCTENKNLKKLAAESGGGKVVERQERHGSLHFQK